MLRIISSMLQKPTREGEQMTCPECGGTIISENKPFNGIARLSWRNLDGSSHSRKDSAGKWVHVKSTEEAARTKSSPTSDDIYPIKRTVWPTMPELSDDQRALYAADDLIEAMAVEKPRKQHPGMEEKNPNVFGQIVSAKSQRIAFVNLAKVFRDHLV